MSQVWSATHLDTARLSGGGTTTVTYSGASGSANVFAANGVSTGKYYWEATLSAASGTPFDSGGFGLGNTSSSVIDGDYLGLGADSIGVYFLNGGQEVDWFNNNTQVLAYSLLGLVVASGDVIGFALDLTNNTFWFRDVTQGSGWFGTTDSGDPSTNTNGFSIVQSGFTVTSNPVVPGATLSVAGDTLVGFFDPTSWIGAVPSGFVGFAAGATAISGNFVGHGNLRANRTPVARRGISRYGGAGSFSVKAAASQLLATARYNGAGSIAASSFISLPLTQSTAGFTGAGSLSVPRSIVLAVDQANYAGTGNFSADATVSRPPTSLAAAFIGAGRITATANLSGRTDISAAFSASGSLSLSRLTALGKISAAYSGTGTLVTAILVGAGTPISGTFIVDELGDQIVDELGNFLASEFQPTAPTQLKAGFAANGSLATSSRLRASGFANYVGTGSLAASLTMPPGGVGGVAKFTGSGSLVAAATIHSQAVTGEASFAGSGSLTTRLVANLRGRARFAGTGSFSTGLDIPAVLARCFGANIGIFFPPAIADAPRFMPATASDAARGSAPLIWLKDVQLRFVSVGEAARGLCATTDAAVARSTLADAPATSVVVAET